MWASKSASFALFALASIIPLHSVKGHGFLETPRSRNYYAHQEGPYCSGSSCPPAEYCHHCLNLNEGVCGKFGSRTYESDTWLDKNGAAMPWIAQETYIEGDEIIVKSYLDTHHNGHMEIRACNKGKDCTVAEFEAAGSALTFVRDNVYEGPEGTPAMPPDPNYPERGMYAGGQGGGIKSFEFVYRLPEGIHGDEVLLQWLYITANSCSPPGYAEYFEANSQLPSSYWTSGLDTCTPPYPNDGARGTTWPERFYNCAEVKVLPASPTISPKPTPFPTTGTPTLTVEPTRPRETPSPTSCLSEYADCTYDWTGCCDGFKCFQVNAAGYGTCLVDNCVGDNPPTPLPTNMPTPPPVTNAPTTMASPPPTNQPTSQPTNAPITPLPTTSNPTSEPTTTSSPIGSAFPAVESDKVRVNQVGYLRFASKVGVVVDLSESPLKWQVQDSVGSVVLAGDSFPFGFDYASEDNVHQVDFSGLTDLGSYKLVVEGIGASVEFEIAPNLYANLPHEAMNYFYFHRMGPDAILAEHLIDGRYARDALHPADNSVPPYPGWCESCENFDLLGSWADAGDFGVYTVNHAISVWTLLNLHELFPEEAFVDGTLNIPESGNGIPDVLDEVNYGSRFVRGMLPSDGGLASHKAHNHAWSAFTITVAEENQNNALGTRSAMGSSTPATFAVARVNAQLARMYASAQGDNQEHVTTLWDAAVDAWQRAYGTNKAYNAGEASPGPALGGGDYPDGQIDDDSYAAAVEMYLTAYALGDSSAQVYKSAMMSSPFFKYVGQWDWASVAAAGTLSLYAVDNDLSAADRQSIEANIVAFADDIKNAIDSEGYPSNLNFPSEYSAYPWGSNSFIMNRMIVLAYAFEVTADVSYQKYLLRSMDYIMGTNAMNVGYVTGYGEKAETDTHDRWAWTIGQDTFWPKGWLSGGPNNELINDYETPSVAAAKSYAGPGTAPSAWGSKENTINWNAPLAWTAWYTEYKIVPNLGGCDGNCPPTAQSQSLKVLMDSSVALTLSASDYDGTIVSWEVVNSPSFGVLSGVAPDLVYTPNTGALGTDSFTFRVVDDLGEASALASVTISVRDCNLIDVFNVPSTYAAFQGSYNYVHVSEDGPSLDNLKTPAHNVQWQDPGLYQFSLELEVEPYYADLTGCTTAENLSGSEASFTLSGCSVNGIDGEYWITRQDGNEIWVEKNNLWALVFTNDENYTPQFCRDSGTSSPTPQVTPNPTQSPVSPPPTAHPTTLSPTSPPTNVPTPLIDSPTSKPTQTPTTTPTKAPSSKPTSEPTPTPPSNSPTTSPPTSGGTLCCADRNTGYQQCNANDWCNKNVNNCNTCQGYFTTVPLQRTGCCSWGSDCSSQDPASNPGCHYLQSDCEQSCGGTWQQF